MTRGGTQGSRFEQVEGRNNVLLWPAASEASFKLDHRTFSLLFDIVQYLIWRKKVCTITNKN
jgi:hypothetical protein